MSKQPLSIDFPSGLNQELFTLIFHQSMNLNCNAVSRGENKHLHTDHMMRDVGGAIKGARFEDVA